MQKTDIKNIFLQACNPKRLPVMLRKIKKRFADTRGLISNEENLKWIRFNCSDFNTFAVSLDTGLWNEAKKYENKFRDRSREILKDVEYNLGRGGIFPLLYFFTRYVQPACIVETGVAAGYSSAAFLSALKINGRGMLYSSDFPYFRIPSPEKYIGILVDDSLKDKWELYINGDENNLPAIINKVTTIDIFHYDSDKSYSGRKFALSMVEKKMSKGGLIIMDDIQDNSHFHDYITSKNIPTWHIFEFEEKFVGVAGVPLQKV